MSIQAMVGVFHQSETRGVTRLVLLSIANHESDDQGAYPSVETIAREAHCSIRAVQTAIAKAVAMGELTVAPRKGPHGTNRYRTRWGSAPRSEPSVRNVFNDVLTLGERDGWTCQYCGVELDSASATRDHVVPRSKGGSDNLSNLVLACMACNTEKGARSPEEWRRQTPQNLHPADSRPVSAPEPKELGSLVSTEEETPVGTYLAPRKRDALFEAIAESCGIDWHELTPSARKSLNTAVKDMRALDPDPDEVRRRAANWPYDVPLTPHALAKHWPALSTRTTRSNGSARRVDNVLALADQLEGR